MSKGKAPAILLLTGLVCAIAGAALTTAQSRFTRHVSPVVVQHIDPSAIAKARTLEDRVSALPATTVVDAATQVPGGVPPDPAASVPDPEASVPELPAVPGEAATVPVSKPGEARLEYVPTTAALDNQLAQVLVAQNSIRKLVGTTGAILPFPGTLRQVEQSGEEIQLKAFGLSGKKLAFDPEQQMFSGTIWLGVAEILAGRPPRPLVTPVEFDVLDADFADPAHVTVEHTGAPYQQVKLRLAAAIDGGTVTVVSNLVPDPLKLELPVSPALLIDVGRNAIEGLGLETSDVNVRLVGVPNPDGRVVTLRATSGFLDPTKLRFDKDGTASTSIRSDAVGDAVITASSAGVVTSSAGINYRLPVITFLASILGGLTGGAIRIGTRPPRRHLSSVRLLIVAVLLGLLVFALYAVGVNVLLVKTPVTVGAALVFAISGLGAFLGPGILKRAP